MFRLLRKQILHKETRPQSTTRIGRRYITDVRRVPSVPVRCVEVDNEDHLYLAGRSMIPTHNSTLGLDFCRAASIHHNLTSVIFSLEMTRNEITMRLLSAEARIPLNHMRNGHMNDEDWTKLARRMGEVSEAPLFIDDSPNMTMMEIRAKARRLKQRHDLRLIVIDYLQLMSSGKKVETRQHEVSEFSRQIKLLAKELEIPIIALSQLNRGPEQRTDKRPMMSDLRESGCVTADTRVMRADTNAEVTIGELMESGATDVPVWALDDRLKLVPRTMTHVFPSGVKDVFELTPGLRPEGEGDGQPPVPHLRRLDAARRARAREPGRGPSGTCRRRWRSSLATTTRSSCSPTCSGTARSCGASRSATRARTRRTSRPSGRRPGTSSASPPSATTTRRPGHHAAPAGAVPAHARQAEPDRGMAGRAGPVRPAQPREVRPGLGLLAARRSRSGSSSATCGRPTAAST